MVEVRGSLIFLSLWIDDDCSTHILSHLQAVCGLFDKSVRTLLYDFGPLVAQLCEMLRWIYSSFPQASVLGLTRQVHVWLGSNNPAPTTSPPLCSDPSVSFIILVDSYFCWRGTSHLEHPKPPWSPDINHVFYFSTRYEKNTVFISNSECFASIEPHLLVQFLYCFQSSLKFFFFLIFGCFFTYI